MKPERCPCGGDAMPRLPMAMVALDTERPKALTRIFADLTCPRCGKAPLEPTSSVAERYGRCAARCCDVVWWHEGTQLVPVGPSGRAFLRYVGIE